MEKFFFLRKQLRFVSEQHIFSHFLGEMPKSFLLRRNSDPETLQEMDEVQDMLTSNGICLNSFCLCLLICLFTYKI